jgi:hypothetical protein
MTLKSDWDPDPFIRIRIGFAIWIRIRTEIKSWIRIRISFNAGKSTRSNAESHLHFKYCKGKAFKNLKPMVVSVTSQK